MMKTQLDLRGLLCPLPVLKAKKALRSLQAGALLEVITTDPGAVPDFQCLAEEDGHELVSQEKYDDECIHLLKKG